MEPKVEDASRREQPMTPAQTKKTQTALALRDLSKHYGQVVAAEQVSLDVHGGEFVTLLGPSGSGKTTTLQMIAGFEKPTSGKVFINGEAVTQPPHKRNIGMVFQNYALFPHMTAARNIEYPLKVRKVGKQERRRRVHEALDMVDLADRGTRYPKQLSGGQQQRIALARALVFRPKIVLLDEPLGALDKKLREHLQLEIKRIQHETGITMIYVTHDQEEALVMSDRIAVFKDGRIRQVGTAEEIYERPSSLFVANFIGESNTFEGTFEEDAGRRIVTDGRGKLTVPSEYPSSIRVGEPAALVVRPERLRIDVPEAGPVAGENRIEATVEEIIYLGNERRYVLRTAAGHSVISRHQVGATRREPRSGEAVNLYWRIEDSVLLPV